MATTTRNYGPKRSGVSIQGSNIPVKLRWHEDEVWICTFREMSSGGPMYLTDEFYSASGCGKTQEEAKADYVRSVFRRLASR